MLCFLVGLVLYNVLLLWIYQLLITQINRMLVVLILIDAPMIDISVGYCKSYASGAIYKDFTAMP